DYGKFKFEEAKAARAAKKKQHVIHLKEVKFRPGIDDHDFDIKTRHASEFLGEGNKVKVTMMFRGRQMAHPELGKAVLDRVASALADVGKVEQEAKLDGRNMIMVLAPKCRPPKRTGDRDAQAEDQARRDEALHRDRKRQDQARQG